MAEPTVQMPTPEQIKDRLIERLRNSGSWPVDEVWQRWQNLFTEYDRDIALFSQPNPTAEPPATYQQGYDDGFMAGERHVRNAETLPAAPPRIADMVPGTTLDEALRWTVRRDRHGNTFLRRQDRSGAYVECWPRDIDPSAIRDVTPPPEH